MSTTVCVDEDDFVVNPDGSLALALCGAPAKEAWPYDCDPATYNPLRVGEGCGLWAPPPADAALVTPDTVTTSGTVGPGNILTLNFDVANPSTCLGAVAMISYEVDYLFELAGSAPGDIMKLYTEFDNGDGSGYSALNRFRLISDVATTDPGINGEETVTFTRTVGGIDPGETRTVKFRLSGDGSNWIINPAKITGRALVVTKS